MSANRLLLIVVLIGWNYCFSTGQITVDFTADVTEGCGSLQVNFCDNSSSSAGSITAWAWNLGGVNSSNECQGRIFGSPGNYEICLTVTDNEGNTATECKVDFITVNPLPEPDFTADNTEGCIPATIAFNYAADPTDIAEYVWGVDGSAGVVTNDGSASPNAESTYTIADQYNISLTVTDNKGCVNFISKSNYITTYEPPEVDFHAVETFGCEPPFSVTFVNDNIEPNTNYTWNFGNGTVYSGDTPPSVLYSTFGTFTVTLVGENSITDCSETLVLEDYINIGNPIEFSFTPTEDCVGSDIAFTDSSPDAADVVSWDFGDGSPLSSAAAPTHAYQNAGFYTVTLTRTVGGCVSSESSTVPVEIFALPNVGYNNDNAFGCTIPHSVNFTGVSSDAISWDWDFGDGNTSTSQNPNHVYSEFGSYNVSLTVTNANGCQNTISTTTIEVTETEARLASQEYFGCTPLSVTLVDSSISVLPITTYNWEVLVPSGTLTSNDPMPSFTIPDTGCFDVILMVTNPLGCSDTTTFERAICVGENPLPNFEAVPLVTCVEDSVFFTDLSSEFADTWFWQFGNDKESSDQNPGTIYVDTGFYDVTLFVADKGCFGEITFENYIQVTEPKSKFTVTQNCNDKFFVEMVNTSIGAESYEWDFGVDGIDTDTSTLFEPTYSYTDTGTYTITLTTFNTMTGCSHAETRKIFVHDPLSSFSVSTTEGCVPMTINGINNSIHATEYAWSGVGMVFSDSSINIPELTFDTPGMYDDLQLIVTDVNGCSDTTRFADTIFVNGIDVDFTPNPIGGCQPFEVTFTDNSTTLFGNNTQWEWVFENNVASAQGTSATHIFENLGKHQVSLTVTNDWGCVENLVVQEAVEVTSPEALFDADTLSCTDSYISFTNNSTGLNLVYDWEFGDGNTSTEENPQHTYMTEGTYSPCLTITDTYGCVNSICLPDHVVIANPVANFSLDTSYASCPPLIVNFENLSLNATSYIWDFGDGSGLSDLDTPSHVYTDPGIYNVTLIATSPNSNCADTFVINNLVVLDGPIGSFHYEIDTSCAPMKVTFFAESQGSFMYVWDYGDGTPLDTVNNVSTDTTVYFYESAGDFIPKLGIIDQIGCERILESPTSIFVPELTLDFVGTDTVLCDFNNPITFFNLINSTGPIDSLSWVFQNGNPSTTTDFEPTVTFDLPGKYDVSIIAHNAYCSDTLTKNDYIRIGDVPIANFSISDNVGCEPLPVNFTDMTTVGNGTPAQWHWIFGDGFESFLQNPTHVYNEESNYSPQLIVTTDIGCADTISKNIMVFAQPEVEITGNKIICINEVTQLNAMITSDTTGINYYWENDPTLSCTDCLNPSANPIDTTVYTFVAVNVEGCESRTEIQIDVRPFFAPTITMSNDTTICANDVVQIFADGGNDIFSYSWDDSQPGLSCYEACLNPVASPDVTTTYSLSVTNNDGCTSMDTVQISVIDPFQPFVSEDRSICQGDTAELHIDQSVGSNPTWINPDGLSCTFCYDPIASPVESKDFIAKVTTTEGCEIFDTIRVDVLTQQNISAGDAITICRGESVMLDGQFLYPSGNINPEITWTPSVFLDDPNIANPETTPNQSLTYTLTILAGDCVLRDSVKVDLIEKTDIETFDLTICEGDTAQLEVIGSADQFDWFPAEGLSDPTIANPIAMPNNEITYTVIASISTCEPDTAEATIFVDELPDVSIPALYTMLNGAPIEIGVENATGNHTFEWFPLDGLSCTDCPSPTVESDAIPEYSVTVTDILTGCTKVLTTKIQQLDYCAEELIGMPNGFTPNGDGINDDLFIKFSSALIIDDFSLKIFDRWGGLLFETNNIYERWDGKSGGKTVPAGVVIYLMEFPCHLDGRMVQKKGDITIYR